MILLVTGNCYYILGTVLFILFAWAEPQEWGLIKKEKDPEEKIDTSHNNLVMKSSSQLNKI